MPLLLAAGTFDLKRNSFVPEPTRGLTSAGAWFKYQFSTGTEYQYPPHQSPRHAAV